MADKDQFRGLYKKYEVTRTDGSTGVGGKHHLCRHFVLDLDHGSKAEAAALEAYANECAEEYPDLATDLRIEAHAIRERQGISARTRK